MRFGHSGRSALAAVADRASELVESMRYYGMLPERLRVHIGEAGFFQTNMATGAAVDHSEIGQPDLLNPSLKMALQGHSIAAIANHLQIAVLIVTPLAEVVFRGSDGKRNQKHQTDHSKRANAIPE